VPYSYGIETGLCYTFPKIKVVCNLLLPYDLPFVTAAPSITYVASSNFNPSW
jgi:hypothetical protein